MPRQFAFRGDRLAYSWGIVLLAAVAFGLLGAFGGDTHALIPLYSVGVFLCFTLSQTGMVRHWLRVREPGWRWRIGDQRGRRGADRRRPGIVVVREVRGRRLPRRHPRPAARRDDAVHPAPVRARHGASWRSDPDLVVPPPMREERVVVPIPGLNRAAIQAINVAPVDRRRRPRRLHLRRPGRGGRASARRLRAAGARASRWSSSSRRTGRWPGRCSPTSTCSTRPGRRTSPSRSPSWSSPSTSPGAGGSGCSTTSRPSGCARCCWAGRTRSSSTCRTGARRPTPPERAAAVRVGRLPAAGDPPRLARDPHELREVRATAGCGWLAGIDRADRHPRRSAGPSAMQRAIISTSNSKPDSSLSSSARISVRPMSR